MKNSFFFAALIFIFSACGNHKSPDVSKVDVKLHVHRFERFVFEKMDTNKVTEGLNEMHRQYPFFAGDFLTNILGLPDVIQPNEKDADVTYRELKRFIHISRPLYDSIAPRFSNFGSVEKELKSGFQHVKYYFPSYQVPEVVTYVGPFDAPAVAITSHAVAIGLQLFAGKDFSFYTSTEGQELYPMYISRRFEKQYIPSGVMTAVIEDLYPHLSENRPLIELMINKGKAWYLLDTFLPETADSVKTGYTNGQIEWCRENEGVIWNFFLQNNDLYTTEPAFIKNYVGEAPYTEGMSQLSPGNIGQWVGWQIVKSYASHHPELRPGDIMKEDPKKIFRDAKYKPR